MKRKPEICEKCPCFHGGVGENGKRFAFCFLASGKPDFYIAVAKSQPSSCSEENFYGIDYDEEFFDSCHCKAEYFVCEWNKDEKKN